MSGHVAHSLTLPAPFPAAAAPLLMHFKSCTRLDRRRLTRPRNGQLNGQSGCRRRRRPCRSCRHNKNVLGAGSSSRMRRRRRSRSKAGTACGKDKCTTNSCTSVAHFNKVNCILALCGAAGGVAEEGGRGTMGNGTEAALRLCLAFCRLTFCWRFSLSCALLSTMFAMSLLLSCCPACLQTASGTLLPFPLLLALFLSLHVQLIIIYFNELPNRISNVAVQTATRLHSDSRLKEKLSLFKQ